MTTIHHVNCGTLVVPQYPTVVCHALLLQEGHLLGIAMRQNEVRRSFRRS